MSLGTLLVKWGKRLWYKETSKGPLDGANVPRDLEKVLAELEAEIYHVPVDRLLEHGRLRADAMVIRDTKAEHGGVTEADWARINELLKESWHSLAKAVKVVRVY